MDSFELISLSASFFHSIWDNHMCSYLLKNKSDKIIFYIIILIVAGYGLKMKTFPIRLRFRNASNVSSRESKSKFTIYLQSFKNNIKFAKKKNHFNPNKNHQLTSRENRNAQRAYKRTPAHTPEMNYQQK